MQHFTSTYKSWQATWLDILPRHQFETKSDLTSWSGMVESSGVGKRHACEEGWQNVKGAKQKEFTISFRYILLSERASTSHWSVANGEHELGSDRGKLVSIFYQWTSRCNNTSNSTSSVLSFQSPTFPVGPSTPSTCAFSFRFPSAHLRWVFVSIVWAWLHEI